MRNSFRSQSTSLSFRLIISEARSPSSAPSKMIARLRFPFVFVRSICTRILFSSSVDSNCWIFFSLKTETVKSPSNGISNLSVSLKNSWNRFVYERIYRILPRVTSLAQDRMNAARFVCFINVTSVFPITRR